MFFPPKHGAPSHTARETISLLQENVRLSAISRNINYDWPTRSRPFELLVGTREIHDLKQAPLPIYHVIYHVSPDIRTQDSVQRNKAQEGI